jgi:hypothetical protein
MRGTPIEVSCEILFVHRARGFTVNRHNLGGLSHAGSEAAAELHTGYGCEKDFEGNLRIGLAGPAVSRSKSVELRAP